MSETRPQLGTSPSLKRSKGKEEGVELDSGVNTSTGNTTHDIQTRLRTAQSCVNALDSLVLAAQANLSSLQEQASAATAELARVTEEWRVICLASYKNQRSAPSTVASGRGNFGVYNLHTDGSDPDNVDLGISPRDQAHFQVVKVFATSERRNLRVCLWYFYGTVVEACEFAAANVESGTRYEIVRIPVENEEYRERPGYVFMAHREAWLGHTFNPEQPESHVRADGGFIYAPKGTGEQVVQAFKVYLHELTGLHYGHIRHQCDTVTVWTAATATSREIVKGSILQHYPHNMPNRSIEFYCPLCSVWTLKKHGGECSHCKKCKQTGGSHLVEDTSGHLDIAGCYAYVHSCPAAGRWETTRVWVEN